jgi:hypothetical protein
MPENSSPSLRKLHDYSEGLIHARQLIDIASQKAALGNFSEAHTAIVGAALYLEAVEQWLRSRT